MPESPAPSRRREFRELGLLLAVAAVIGLITVLGQGPQFFNYQHNITRLLRMIGLLGVFAVGEAVVIIAGGIDLSVGSVIGITGMLAAMIVSRLAQQGTEITLPLVLLVTLAMMLLGVVIGAFHALLITRFRLPPFIATLSTLAGLRSAAQLVTRSAPVPVPQAAFRSLGAGLNPLWIFLAVAILVGLIMTRTRLGRSILALGGNEEAARLSGISTNRVKAVCYCLSGGLAGLAGVLWASFIGQGVPTTGNAYELQAIAACVVGGCSLTGGVGTVVGTCLGVVLLQTTLNGIGLVVKQNSTLWQGIVVGVVVILAVALNTQRQRRADRLERF